MSDLLKVFIFFWIYFVIGRVYELYLTKTHAKVWVDELSSKEVGIKSRNMMVVLHSSWFIALVFEAFYKAEVTTNFNVTICFILLMIAQLLRFHSMSVLGPLWSTRIYYNEHPPLSREGLYRWVRHPNYFAVVLEFIAFPLMFGLWRTMIIFSVLNILMLYFRTKLEEEVLGSQQASWRVIPGLF